MRPVNDPQLRAEVLRLLRSLQDGRDELNAIIDGLDEDDPLDMSGCDLHGLVAEGVNFAQMNLDRADLRGAVLDECLLREFTGVRLDGVALSGAWLPDATDCTLTGATLRDVSWNPNTFTRCDFSGAVLTDISGGWCTVVECAFVGAAFRGDTDLEESKFGGCDFSRADLTGAKLLGCDFTGATQAGADLTGADLRRAKFVDADLRGTVLRGASLAGADLTGARVHGADFTGADLAGAVLGGVDPTVATNLRTAPTLTSGPHLRELATVAARSKRCDVSVEMDLVAGARVQLIARGQTYAGRSVPEVAYVPEFPDAPGRPRCGTVRAATLEHGVLELIDLWSAGQPDWAMVDVSAEKCPPRPAELRELAVAAWHEALGLPVPTAAERGAELAAKASAAAALRAAMLAELTGGPAGVSLRNARRYRARERFGPLRGHDLTGLDLTGVQIGALDLRRAKLDGGETGRGLSGPGAARACYPRGRGPEWSEPVRGPGGRGVARPCRAHRCGFTGHEPPAGGLGECRFDRGATRPCPVTRDRPLRSRSGWGVAGGDRVQWRHDLSGRVHPTGGDGSEDHRCPTANRSMSDLSACVYQSVVPS